MREEFSGTRLYILDRLKTVHRLTKFKFEDLKSLESSDPKDLDKNIDKIAKKIVNERLKSVYNFPVNRLIRDSEVPKSIYSNEFVGNVKNYLKSSGDILVDEKTALIVLVLKCLLEIGIREISVREFSVIQEFVDTINDETTFENLFEYIWDLINNRTF